MIRKKNKTTIESESCGELHEKGERDLILMKEICSSLPKKFYVTKKTDAYYIDDKLNMVLKELIDFVPKRN